MIAKLIKGRGFRGALEYTLQESKGFLLDSNMGGDTPRTLAREFGQIRALRPEISRPVHHTSLALPPAESLTDEQWKEVGRKYLQHMGFNNNQYVIARHTDAEHTHVHILANRISLDGKLVSDSKDYHRQEQIMRLLEKEYNLTPVPPSKEALRRAPSKGELECALKTGKASAKMVLQKLVDKALKDSPGYTEFTSSLESSGVNTIPNMASTGRISGISFQYEGVTMKGSDLGRGYTWASLQKRGLCYEQIRYTGKGCGRGDTETRTPFTGNGDRSASTASAGFADGGFSQGDRAAYAGNIHPQRSHSTGYFQSGGAVPRNAELHFEANGENVRGGEAGAGQRSSFRQGRGTEPAESTGGQSGNLGSLADDAGTYAESACPGGCMEVGLPASSGNIGESALGRITALAVAGLRQHNEVSGTNLAKAGDDHPGRGQERNPHAPEAVSPQRKRNREERGR